MSQPLAVRVDRLERRVEALDALPERIASLESQFVQFREEVRGEFSAVRMELRAEMRAQGEQLRKEIREGDEETRRLMRVLHEDVISRLKTIQEGQPPAATSRARGKPTPRPKR